MTCHSQHDLVSRIHKCHPSVGKIVLIAIVIAILNHKDFASILEHSDRDISRCIASEGRKRKLIIASLWSGEFTRSWIHAIANVESQCRIVSNCTIKTIRINFRLNSTKITAFFFTIFANSEFWLVQNYKQHWASARVNDAGSWLVQNCKQNWACARGSTMLDSDWFKTVNNF